MQLHFVIVLLGYNSYMLLSLICQGYLILKLVLSISISYCTQLFYSCQKMYGVKHHNYFRQISVDNFAVTYIYYTDSKYLCEYADFQFVYYSKVLLVVYFELGLCLLKIWCFYRASRSNFIILSKGIKIARYLGNIAKKYRKSI